MRRLAAAFALAVGLIPVGASAQENPVVIELFTSQGCSSCPPADRLLKELAQSDNVIALAWHVDYWDYLGWKDAFAAPEYTRRQKYYAMSMGERMIYTPQIVVDGSDHTVGGSPSKVMALIKQVHSGAPKADLTVTQRGGRVKLTAELLAQPGGKIEVHLVRYKPQATITIKRGENAGETVTYTNIVNDWQTVGDWNGRGVLTLEFALPAGDPAVVILQREKTGPILAAAKLN